MFFLILFYPFILAGLTIEVASTPEQIAWGLMGRKEIPDDYGMLFVYETPKITSVWMFNCFVDLSVAFIDENGVIQEIHDLKAYPEKMDPKRPVKSINDLWLYPYKDPIVQFFHSNNVTSSFAVKYILEMKKGGFEKNGFKVGSVIKKEIQDDKRIFITK